MATSKNTAPKLVAVPDDDRKMEITEIWEIQAILAGAQAIVRNAIEDIHSNEHERCQHIENCINVAQRKLGVIEDELGG